jgi:hypothetical protein
MPAFGQSFPDVPRNHWAYEAINKLAAAGVIEGFPDGEYKGQQSMTRYEMAVLISRALDNIIAEQEAMAAEMEAMGEGLTSGQAEDVTAIVRSLMEKNTQDTLSDSQAQEVADIVDALTFELRAELRVLGADIDGLYADMDALEAKVDSLDIPQDNIEWAGSTSTVFEISDYGDNPNAVAELWADGDALDLDLPTATDANDASDFPAEKAFYQELDLSISAMLSDVYVDLELGTLSSNFTEVDGHDYMDYGYTLGDFSEEPELLMDSISLTITKDEYEAMVGDLDGFHAASYFIDDEDMKGINVRGPLYGVDMRAFIVGGGASNENDYYGLEASTMFDMITLTGKLYHGRFAASQVTNGAVEAAYDVNEVLTVNGEAVYNSVTNDASGIADTTSQMFGVGASYNFTDVWALTAGVEIVGEDFNANLTDDESLHDLTETSDYEKYTVGAEYLFNENNIFTADYSFVTRDSADVDQSVIELGLDNEWNNFTNTATVEFNYNDGFIEDQEYTLVKLGTEYDWTEATTLSGGITFKDDGPTDFQYTYLTAGVDHDFTEHVGWGTELKYITGTNETGIDGEGNSINTSLTISF